VIFHPFSFIISQLFHTLAHVTKLLKAMRSKYLAAVLLFSAVLISCNGSKDDDENLNIITFGDNQFSLYRGFYTKLDTLLSTGATPFIINLLGEGVTINSETDQVTGTGSLIRAYFYSDNNIQVSNGLYTIDPFNKKESNGVDSCVIYYNYNFEVDTGAVYTIYAGTFNVYNLGRIMSYKIDVQTKDLTHFTGEFQGTMDQL